jgi:peptide/nickel transport system permease protein
MIAFFARRIALYCFTFFCAVTLNWAIPHAMPGDPINLALYQRFGILPDRSMYEYLFSTFGRAFRPDLPLWRQYLYYWDSLLHGNLGISITYAPNSVFLVIQWSIPYTLGLLVPATALSWYLGNKFGALAARRKFLDNTLLPISYVLSASPYMWMAALMAWLFGFVWGLFPGQFAYSRMMTSSWSIEFILDLLYHWFLPFLSLFLVAFGGWAMGMRSLMVYELDSDYARYLESLGAPKKLMRKYAFRNAMLPQISNLSVQIGVALAGAMVTEWIFAYPGVGYILYRAISARDLFLVQGIFLFTIAGVLIANLIVDILCVIIDPRTRIGMEGGEA